MPFPAICNMQNFKYFDPQAQPKVHSGDTKRSEALVEFFTTQLSKINSDFASFL